MLVTVIWGATFLFTKLGLDYTNPSLFVIIRFLIALVTTLAIFGRHFKGITKADFQNGIILGLLFGGGFLLQTYGLKFTSVSKSAFITGLTVPVTPFVFWLISRKPVLFWSKVGVTIAFAGLWIFTNPTFDSINQGDVITLFSTLFWAFYITYIDKFTKNVTDFRITSQYVMLQFVGAIPLFIAAFFIFDFSSVKLVFTWELAGALAFNAIMASVIVTFVHTGVQKFTTPVKAALIFSMEPIFASTFSYFFMNEFPTGWRLFGGMLMILGVLAGELGQTVQNKLRKSLQDA